MSDYEYDEDMKTFEMLYFMATKTVEPYRAR